MSDITNIRVKWGRENARSAVAPNFYWRDRMTVEV